MVMTRQRDRKALIRARQAKTGESYNAARRHFLSGRHNQSPIAGVERPPDQIRVAPTLELKPVIVRRFRTPDEAKAVRPRLDDRAVLLVSEFVDITGKCEFPKGHQVSCQLATETGICNQVFGKGWTMRGKEGVEVFVGHVCAKRQFQDHIRFVRETARADNDVTVADYVARLQDLLVDPQTKPRMEAAETRRIDLLKRVEDVRIRVTHEVRERVNRLGKAPISAIELEFETKEKIEASDGTTRIVSKWIPTVVAILAAPRALDLARFNKLTRSIQRASKALGEAEASIVHSVRTLRSWCAHIEGIAESETVLDDISRDLAAFIEPNNLRSIVWLGRTLPERLAITACALRILGEPKVTRDMALAAYSQWETKMRASNGNRSFRVP
jgi:hypothetical protein